MLEDDQFRLWLSSESAIVPNSWTKAKSIMHNRNIVTRDTVEVHLSLVCGKTLHPFKSRHYSWLFSFQVVHLYETPLISVLACSFMCCLPHKGFYQQILRGNAFRWCTVQRFGAAWSYGLSSPLVFAWLEADGGGVSGSQWADDRLQVPCLLQHAARQPNWAPQGQSFHGILKIALNLGRR